MFLIALVTSAATATGVVYLNERHHFFSEPEVAVERVTVPSLVGLMEADARENAKVLGFVILVEKRVPKRGTKPGTVIEQSVDKGQQVNKGGAVSLVIAAAMPKVPAVVGKSVDEAKKLLAKAGFEFKLGKSLASERHPEEAIADQTPDGGAPAAPGQVVEVRVSSGAGEADVPNLAGMGMATAKQHLEDLGLKPRIQWVDRAETPSFVVLGQQPAAGQKAKTGDAVSLVINRGD